MRITSVPVLVAGALLASCADEDTKSAARSRPVRSSDAAWDAWAPESPATEVPPLHGVVRLVVGDGSYWVAVQELPSRSPLAADHDSTRTSSNGMGTVTVQRDGASSFRALLEWDDASRPATLSPFGSPAPVLQVGDELEIVLPAPIPWLEKSRSRPGTSDVPPLGGGRR